VTRPGMSQFLDGLMYNLTSSASPLSTHGISVNRFPQEPRMAHRPFSCFALSIGGPEYDRGPASAPSCDAFGYRVTQRDSLWKVKPRIIKGRLFNIT
jgi:hypothetical protein